MHYETDTKEIRDARESVTEAKENIQIANLEKEISGLNDIIDNLDKKIEESNEYYDKLIEQTEKYWDSLIKGLEDYKLRWTELSNIEEKAKMEVALKNLGITTDDILNMSEYAFETFKGDYLGILQEMYSGNDEMISMLQELGGISPDALQPLSDTLNDVKEQFDEINTSAYNTEGQIVKVADELTNLNGMTSECTVKVNIETTGSIPEYVSKIPQIESISSRSLKSKTVGNAYAEGTVGNAFATGTDKYNGLPHAEKNALVSEYGQTEMTVLPNGQTIITDKPTLMDLPKDTVIYNEKQTKKIMDNKVDVSGKSYDNGTSDGSWIGTDGHRYRPLQQGDKGYDLMKAFEPLVQKILSGEEEIISNAVFAGQKQMEQWTKEITNNTVINNISNNRSVQ